MAKNKRELKSIQKTIQPPFRGKLKRNIIKIL